MAEGHPPAAAMASYRRSRLPFARPQTLQTLQKSAQLRREKVPQQAQHAPLLATPNAAGKSHHKATAMAQEHPTATAMAIRASYRRSRLPFARTQKPPQGHSNGWRAPPGRSNPARTSHPKATAMAEGHPPAAAMASYRRSRLPFARPQTLQTLQKSAQLRREKVPQQAQHAPLLATPNAAGKSHHKATAMAQEHPTAAAMAYFIGVQGCRLRGLKPSKQWLKGTPRSQQWLLIGI